MPKKVKKKENNVLSLFPEEKVEECSVEESVVTELFENIDEPQVACCHRNGILFQSDSLSWLKTLKSESADVVFADPPYNIKKADWDKFESQEAYIQWSMEWISECSRILKPTGCLFICGFSEILADLKHPSMKFFNSCKWLVWYYKNKANLGKDWGRSHESILLLRKSKNYTMNIDLVRIPYNEHTLKYPSHPQSVTSQFSNGKQRKTDWVPHPLGAKPKDVIEIPTTCNGMEEKTKHPTQKPEELLRKILLSSSNPGDVVLDPFSGSGTTVVVAEQLCRKWIGCDMNAEYNSWAKKRLNSIKKHDLDYWLRFDRENNQRRESIR